MLLHFAHLQPAAVHLQHLRGHVDAEGQRLDDEVLHEYACVGTYDEIADKLAARYGGLVSNVEFSIPVTGERDAETLRGMIARLRAA